jgi:hypothetical protein
MRSAAATMTVMMSVSPESRAIVMLLDDYRLRSDDRGGHAGRWLE